MAKGALTNAKRMKTEKDVGVEPLHIGEDLSSPNTSLVAAINCKLYLDEKTADVFFLLETNDGKIDRIPAHKAILTTGSKVFETMFYGSIPEGSEVKIPNGNSAAFKEFLQFFYIDQITMTPANINDVMNFVRQYGIERCMVQCVDFLKDTLTNDDVCSCYQLAIQFELVDLKHFCERKISGNAEDVLKTEGFLNASWDLLQLVAGLHPLVCQELDAFVAWAKKSCEKNGLDPRDGKNLREQLGESILHLIQFKGMNIKDFARNAKYEGLFTMSELLEIVQIIGCKDYKPNIFTEKPFTCTIFMWDAKRILCCSLRESTTGRKLIQRDQSMYLSCNKPILLKKFRLAKVYPSVNFFERSATSQVRIALYQKCNSGEDAIEKWISYEYIYVSEKDDVIGEFSRPLFIHPKRKYRIRLESSHQEFETPDMKCGVTRIDDLKLKFGLKDKRLSTSFRFPTAECIVFQPFINN